MSDTRPQEGIPGSPQPFVPIPPLGPPSWEPTTPGSVLTVDDRDAQLIALRRELADAEAARAEAQKAALDPRDAELAELRRALAVAQGLPVPEDPNAPPPTQDEIRPRGRVDADDNWRPG